MTASPASTHAVHHRTCSVQPQLCPNLSTANCREMMTFLWGFKLASGNWEAPPAAALLKVFMFSSSVEPHTLMSAFVFYIFLTSIFSLGPACCHHSKGCSSSSLCNAGKASDMPTAAASRRAGGLQVEKNSSGRVKGQSVYNCRETGF